MKQNGDKQFIRCRVQNTSDKDPQRTHWALKQHEKDPGRSEGYTK